MRRVASGRDGDAAREPALIGYGLLLAAIFFFGATALVAVVIAYSKRGAASPLLRSHYDFQVRIFWTAFFLALVSGAAGLAGVIAGLGELMAATSVSVLAEDQGVQVDMSHMTLNRPVLALFGTAMLFGVAGVFWLIVTPTLGFIRLASGRPMRDSPAQ